MNKKRILVRLLKLKPENVLLVGTLFALLIALSGCASMDQEDSIFYTPDTGYVLDVDTYNWWVDYLETKRLEEK